MDTWLKVALAITAVCFRASSPAADARTNRPPSLAVRPTASATNALASFRVHNGFRIELAAAEPMVTSPVALAFDENGRLFVAERRTSEDGLGLSTTRGRVRLLEDPDDEGVYRSSKIYADDLPLVSGVACYAGGVYVTAAPYLLYLKDTQKDGLADVRRVVLSGFSATNDPGLRPSHLTWGLDNRIHGARGAAGGLITSSNWPDQAVTLAGSDFSFDPRSFALFAEAGPGLTGMSFDNAGRKYVCGPAAPLEAAIYDLKYWARNPFFARAPDLGQVLAGPLKVFRFVEETQGSGGKTNALMPGFSTNIQSLLVYRGSLFPTGFVGNAFLSCADTRVVHRVVLRDGGLVPVPVRAKDENDSEFLVSEDARCFPTQLINGPEGGLYLADRRTQPEQGRIYRIVPASYKRQKPPQLGQAKTYDLVATLASPNGWHRDTAARLLYERRDSTAVSLLTNMLASARAPITRLQALHALDGLQALGAAHVLRGLRDIDANVREHALQLLGRVVGQPNFPEEIYPELARLAIDRNPRLRLQLAFALGDISRPDQAEGLAQVLLRDPADPWFQTAVLSSTARSAGSLFMLLAGNQAFRESPMGFAFLQHLADSIGLKGQSDEVQQVLDFLAQPRLEPARTAALLWPVGEGLRRTGSSLALVDSQARLQKLYSAALDLVISSGTPPAVRIDAVRLLAVAPLTYADTGDWLLALCAPQPFPQVRAAALSALGNYDEPAMLAGVLDRWPNFDSHLRQHAVAALLVRVNHWRPVMEALAARRISPEDVPPTQINLLRTSPDDVVSSRANQIFGPLGQHATNLVEKFKPAFNLKGNRARGQSLFAAACAACHRFAGQEQGFGPDLNALSGWDRKTLVRKIVAPNASVSLGYETSVVRTALGEVQAGIAVDSNDQTLTLKRPEGSLVWGKAAIQRLDTATWSIMPDTFGLQLAPQDMADLIDYLLPTP